MNCKHCGKPVDFVARFCMHCGRQLDETSKAGTESTRRTFWDHLGIRVVSIALLAIGIGSVFYFSSSKSDTSKSDLSNEPQNNIDRAQVICETELAIRLKLSGGQDFSYPPSHRFHRKDGSYLIDGNFKDGQKHGKFTCETKYVYTAQTGAKWQTSVLTVSWGLHPPPGHKDIEELIEKSASLP